MITDILFFLKPEDLVFDIGGNNGINTQLYLNKGCRVVVAEPQPRCIENLQQKYATNKNVTILQKAISNTNEKTTLYICNTDHTLSTVVPEKWKYGRFKKIKNDWNTYIEVETLTLDDMIQLYGVPAFCKIDTEGYEYNVLQGLTQLISTLSFEYTCEFIHDAYKCLSYLTTLGYTKFNMTNHNNNYIFKYPVSENDIKNYKFPHPEEWGDIYAFIN